MKIAILGCGAIGGLCLGYLSGKDKNVIGIVKEYQKEVILKEGLVIEGIRGKNNFKVKVATSLQEPVDIAIFASKINDLENMIKKNAAYLKNAVAVTTQNGVRADYLISNYFPKSRIINGIVMFGATFYPPNKIVHNFEGDLILGNILEYQPVALDKMDELFFGIFKVIVLPNLKGAKYLKLFVNLNNAIAAVLGISMQEAFADLAIAKLAILLNREAYSVVLDSGVELVSLPNYPKERLEGLVNMEINQASGIFSKVMTGLSKEPLYGSILQSIQRGSLSEIDYINGEIVKLAKQNDLTAPLNEKIVELVHRVEKTKKFLTKGDLVKELTA